MRPIKRGANLTLLMIIVGIILTVVISSCGSDQNQDSAQGINCYHFGLPFIIKKNRSTQ